MDAADILPGGRPLRTYLAAGERRSLQDRLGSHGARDWRSRSSWPSAWWSQLANTAGRGTPGAGHGGPAPAFEAGSWWFDGFYGGWCSLTAQAARRPGTPSHQTGHGEGENGPACPSNPRRAQVSRASVPLPRRIFLSVPARCIVRFRDQPPSRLRHAQRKSLESAAR